MSKISYVFAAVAAFMMIVVVVIPMFPEQADHRINAENDGYYYKVQPVDTRDTYVLKMIDGAFCLNGQPITGEGPVRIVSDVAVFEVDPDTGGYTGAYISYTRSGRTLAVSAVSSEDNPDTVYTFSEMKLDIKDTELSLDLWTWYRVLFVPSATGSHGVWDYSSLPFLTISSNGLFSISGMSEDYCGMVYGYADNLAAGLNVQDETRTYGTASAVYTPALNGDAIRIWTVDTDGNILHGDMKAILPITYSYIEPVPFIEQTTNILYIVCFILLLIAVIYTAIKVIK